jgi:iron complex outermembrane receptor protein
MFSLYQLFRLFVPPGVFLLTILCPASGLAQTTGTIRGTIMLSASEKPLHDVLVSLTRLSRKVETNENGEFEFRNVPAGTWTLLAHLEGFPDAVRTVTVSNGETVTVDIKLKLSGIRDQVTVSATGSEQSTFDAFQSVTSLDSLELSARGQPSLGEMLDKQPGIAKRSFGPGSTRPVIRGFDGDRVLVLQDGMSVGSMGSQSGDHGEPIDVLSLERLEVVKGPAALLYGSNAIGGVVNAVTSHGSETHPHPGARGYLTGIGATNARQASGGGGIEYGAKNFLLWASGSGQRLGDYTAPKVGEIGNSKVKSASGAGGAGFYGERGYFSGEYNFDTRRYGIPFAGLIEGEPDALVDLDMRRHNLRLSGGAENLGAAFDSFRFTLNYSDYQHREIHEGEIGTLFNNDVFVYRGLFQQKRRGFWSGSFGFQGTRREYESIGDEALAPPTTQNAFAVFGLQEFDYKRVGFQLGGRLEHNRYAPVTGLSRNFTGFSGAAGVRVPLWEGGAFVANYTHSYRAPALEELYNNGPHPGNLTFEIGDVNLKRERGDGIDLSLRHSHNRARAEANFFYYSLKDFIFLAPTGNIEDGLPEAEYRQADSRYLGTELRFDMNVAPTLWVNFGMDYVSAELKASGLSLPRIPPLRGRIGFDWHWKDFNLRPEVILVRDQSHVFTNETRTPGYITGNLDASYTLAHQHYAQIFGVNFFNVNDKLYRNHTSFIKDLAPEIGRGVRVSYTIRFF